MVLDSGPTPDEIDRALGRLEILARERAVAVGMASALPVSIDHIAKWAKAAGKPRPAPGADHRGRRQGEAELKGEPNAKSRIANRL